MRFPARNLSSNSPTLASWLCCFLLGFVDVSLAVTVPDDYPTIQSALDDLKYGSLPSGSIIEVRSGTFNEALTYAESPKSFSLRSLSGAAQTIIDATGTGRSAVFIRDTAAIITIEGFTITGGKNPTDGGLSFKNAAVNIKDCMIEENFGYHGGGLQLYGSNTTIENSTFRENVASKSAGGIAIVGGSVVTIIDSDILDNIAGASDSVASGGGIRVGNSSVVIRRTRISNNYAKFAGGGIFTIGEFDDPFGVTSLTLEDSVISNNQVIHDPGFPTGAGGGVHIEGNAAAHISDSIITDNVSSGRGGGLNTFQAHYDIIGTLIEFNQALAGTGGGIHGFSQLPAGSSVHITDSVVRSNTALNSGGISLGGNSCGTGGVCANLQIERALVEGNTALYFGGGINIDNAAATVLDSQIIGNRAVDATDGAGGGLRVTSSSADIQATMVLGNFAGLTGGGVFVGNDSDVNIDGSIIYSNEVGHADKGGGIHISSAGPPTGIVGNSVIADNTSFQIREQSCPPELPAPILSYLDNTISSQPLHSLYKSPCQPEEIHDIEAFNALSPDLKTVNNVASAPDFSALTAISLPFGRNVLTWAKAGVNSVDIVNLASFPRNHGTIDIFPACTKTFSLGPDMVTIPGSGAETLEISGRRFRRVAIIEAKKGIHATASTIDSVADTTFKAGNSISLGQSFAVAEGGTFRAHIDPEVCP